jgi:hypothetical protein
VVITRARFDAIALPEPTTKSKRTPLSGSLASRLVIPAERETFEERESSRLIYNGRIRETDLLPGVDAHFRDCMIGPGRFTSMRVSHAQYPLPTTGFVRRHLLFST